MARRKRKLKVAKRLVKVHKRRGGHEKYEPKKLESSCYKAGLSAQLSAKEARKLASVCTRDVSSEVKKHKDITSHELRNLIIRILEKHNKDVALMYRAIKEVD